MRSGVEWTLLSTVVGVSVPGVANGSAGRRASNDWPVVAVDGHEAQRDNVASLHPSNTHMILVGVTKKNAVISPKLCQQLNSDLHLSLFPQIKLE